MPTSSPAVLFNQASVTSLLTVDLDAVDVERLAQALAGKPRVQLMVDCHTLRCQRTLGVSHVVSQLLQLRRSGASIWLHNVNPTLKRCLQMLHLNDLFLLS